MMHLKIDNLPAAICASKTELRRQLANYREVFAELDADMRRQIALSPRLLLAHLWSFPYDIDLFPSSRDARVFDV
ncbi:hypothetical protein [Erwinia piriflorinigrans]|uniref:Uncharacterized protein n=1 Tax=Erwinia piriflorinigrans CFBP 5888 TaxID=1161919 RepID=V5ZAD5_9GAMM|nr:hypothetical protein [Erwinia piriflorinigrans]CCG87913.1 hypothetical protein EPIR_2550 [Erwinia piriflorinigrans CFBP 5888]